MFFRSLSLAMLGSSVFTDNSTANCNNVQLKFIVLDGDATLAAIEDDIRADLEKIGISVTLELLQKDAFNTAMVEGDFNLAFSETYGLPYDPHSHAASWSSPDEAYFAALEGLPEPFTQDALDELVDEVLTQPNETLRQTQWTQIFEILHEAVTELPLAGKSIPAVYSNRLTSYRAGLQQFDYPMHTITVVSGSNNITVAAAGQTGYFNDIGRLDPHSYRPNEFFINNWVYEGLVEYGPGGEILPSLATN